MYQKGCSRDPFTAATEACRRRKKGGGNGRNSVACFSPWSVVSCWFRIRRSKHGTISLEEDTGHEDAVDFLDPESSNSDLDVSGEHKKEASLTLGVGIGLMYLMATNKNEISKLVELCQRMESMIQNFHREFVNHQRNDENISNSYSTPKAQIVPNYPVDHLSVQDCPSYSWEHENSNSEFTSSSYQNSYTRVKGKGKKLEMDQLEAELEAELKSLQLHLDDEVVLSYSNQNHSEIVIEESAFEETNIANLQEAEDLEMENMEHQGVHPRELEKRLLELQQVRQEERIRELESALENATNTIHQNQKDISWWKDTARIVFKNSDHRSLQNSNLYLEN